MFAVIAALALALARPPLDGDLPRRLPSMEPREGGRTLLVLGGVTVASSEVLAIVQRAAITALMGAAFAMCFGLATAWTLRSSHRNWQRLARLARNRAFAVGAVESGHLITNGVTSELVIRLADGGLTTLRPLHWLAPRGRSMAKIAPGDQVVAVAHAVDDARAVVFGAPGDPRRAIRWAVLGWTARWWLLVAVSVTCGLVVAAA